MRIFIILGVFLLASFTICYSQVNLSSGLVAYYPFTGNPNDASGNGHNGQLVNNFQLTTDRFGNPNSAYFFNGIDNYIKVQDDGSFSTPYFSIALWFQTSSNNLQNLVGKRDFTTTAGTGGAQYQFFIDYPPFPGIGSNIVGNNSSCTNISSSSYINTGEWICPNKWYFAVIIFDGSFHKIYINGVLKQNVPTAFNGFLSCNSELRFGNWWQSDLIPFNGKMDDIRWYNRALNDQEVTALYGNYVSSAPPLDFSYSQNVCSPNTVNFFTNLSSGQAIQSYSWDFGNGPSYPNLAFPSVSFPGYNNYPVKLQIQYTNGCKDSVVKSVPVFLNQDNIIATADTTICEGSSLTLKTAGNFQDFCWQPGAGTATVSNLTVNPASTTTYSFTAQTTGGNLVTNGDFSGGNTGFTSDYTFNATSGTGTGVYNVAANPQAWNASLSACTDHTTGTANMLMVNGVNAIDKKVWSETITVQPNTNYQFSAWLQSLSAVNTGVLKFAINGLQISTWVGAPSQTCSWKQYKVPWNSGASTTAILTIQNENPNSPGNLFALDDIFFGDIALKTDSVKVTVSAKPNVSSRVDTTICLGSTVTLTTTSDATSFNWSPGTGLSNPNILSPLATPPATTQYIVTAGTGCTARDTVVVTVISSPHSLQNRTYCSGDSVLLTSSGTTNILWNTGSTATSIYAITPGTYWVQSGTGTCMSIDSFVVSARTLPVVNLGKDTSFCQPGSIVLNAGNASATYLWQNGQTSQTITANQTGTYYVTVTNNGCTASDSINLTIFNKPILIARADTTICTGSTLTLTTTSDGIGFNWSPATGLSNPNIPAPVATPPATTQYIVTAINAAGCSARDTVNVTVTPPPHSLQSKTYCAGDSVLLTSGSSFNMLWSTGSTATSIYASVPGTYWVQSSVGSCTRIDSFTVVPKALPVVNLGKDTALCISDSLLLNAGNAGASYLWQNGQSSQTFTVHNADLYYVTVNSNGCTSSDSISVSSLSLPVPIVSSDTTICAQGNAVLSGGGGTSYLWSPGVGLSNPNSATTNASPSATTKYTLTVIGQNGCRNSIFVTVAVNPAPAFQVSATKNLVCKGDTALLSASGGDTYSWSPASSLSNPSGNNTLAFPSSSTEYQVIIQNNACRVADTLDVNIPVADKPSVSTTKSNDIDCFIGQAKLTAGGGSSYVWSPGANLSDSTSSHPVASPSVTTTYHVFIISPQGCMVEDTITVFVSRNGDGGFLVPSAFTPNNDGKNDCFGVRSWGSGITNFSINLYNRWGQLLFHADDPSQCWDGIFNGQPQPGDVYVYWIRAKSPCGDVFRKGTFVLIK